MQSMLETRSLLSCVGCSEEGWERRFDSEFQWNCEGRRIGIYLTSSEARAVRFCFAVITLNINLQSLEVDVINYILLSFKHRTINPVKLSSHHHLKKIYEQELILA